MTTTETITHRVYNRHAGLTPEVEHLGRLAAECELWSELPDTPDWERPQLKARAQSYREAQAIEMSLAQARVNPYRKLDDWSVVHQVELEDQARAIEPYPLAGVLGPSIILAALRGAASKLRAFPSIIFAVIVVILALFILL